MRVFLIFYFVLTLPSWSETVTDHRIKEGERLFDQYVGSGAELLFTGLKINPKIFDLFIDPKTSNLLDPNAIIELLRTKFKIKVFITDIKVPAPNPDLTIGNIADDRDALQFYAAKFKEQLKKRPTLGCTTIAPFDFPVQRKVVNGGLEFTFGPRPLFESYVITVRKNVTSGDLIHEFGHVLLTSALDREPKYYKGTRVAFSKWRYIEQMLRLAEIKRTHTLTDSDILNDLKDDKWYLNNSAGAELDLTRFMAPFLRAHNEEAQMHGDLAYHRDQTDLYKQKLNDLKKHYIEYGAGRKNEAVLIKELNEMVSLFNNDTEWFNSFIAPINEKAAPKK